MRRATEAALVLAGGRFKMTDYEAQAFDLKSLELVS
jgi:hypothetical protein